MNNLQLFNGKRDKKSNGSTCITEASLVDRLNRLGFTSLQNALLKIPELKDRDVLREKIQVLESMLQWEPRVLHDNISNVLTAFCIEIGDYSKAETYNSRLLECGSTNLSCLVNSSYLNLRLRKLNEAEKCITSLEEVKSQNAMCKLLVKSDLAFMFTKCSPLYYIQAISIYEDIILDSDAKEHTPDSVLAWQYELAVCYRRLIRSKDHLNTAMRDQNISSIHDVFCRIQQLHEYVQESCRLRDNLGVIEGRSYAELAMAYFRYEPWKTAPGSKDKTFVIEQDVKGNFDKAEAIAGADHHVLEQCATFARIIASDEKGYTRCIEYLQRIFEENPKRHPVVYQLALAYKIRWIIKNRFPEAKIYQNRKRTDTTGSIEAQAVVQTEELSPPTTGEPDIYTQSILLDTPVDNHLRNPFGSLDISIRDDPSGTTMEVHPSDIAKLHSSDRIDTPKSTLHEHPSDNVDISLDSPSNSTSSLAEIDSGILYAGNLDDNISGVGTDKYIKSDINELKTNSEKSDDGCVKQMAKMADSGDLKPTESQSKTVLPIKHLGFHGVQKHSRRPGYFDELKASNPRATEEQVSDPDFQNALEYMEKACHISFDTRCVYFIELGRMYVTKQNYQKAKECFKKAIATKAIGNNDYAYLYEQWALAIEADLDSPEEEKQNAQHLYRLSIEHSLHGHLRSRLAYYKLRDFLKRNIHVDTTTALELTKLEELVEKYASAGNAINIAIQQHPNNSELMWKLVYILHKNNKDSEAYTYLTPLLLRLSEEQTVIPHPFKVTDLLDVIVNAAKRRKECGCKIYATCFRYFTRGGVIETCDDHPPMSSPVSIENTPDTSDEFKIVPSGSLANVKSSESLSGLDPDDFQHLSFSDYSDQRNSRSSVNNASDENESAELNIGNNDDTEGSAQLGSDLGVSSSEFTPHELPAAYDIVIVGGPSDTDLDKPPHINTLEKLLTSRFHFQVFSCRVDNDTLKTYSGSVAHENVLTHSTGVLVIVDDLWNESMFTKIKELSKDRVCYTFFGESLPTHPPFCYSVHLTDANVQNIEQKTIECEHDIIARIFRTLLLAENAD